jgi:ligand-binding sensor domain-containing protein
MDCFAKKTFIFTFLIGLTLLIPERAYSQNYYTRNISVEDGLPSNSVQDIFKDSRGYLWFGTEAGLCRYDGINLKTFTTIDGLPGNRIWSVTEDQSGNIWIACYGSGISRFDGKSFKNFSVKDGLINNYVRKIEFSKRHNGLMIGTEFGFSFYNNTGFISFVDSAATDRNLFQVTSFLDTDSMIYIITYYDSKGFLKFDSKASTFAYLNPNHRFHYKTKHSTSSFITSLKDTIIGDYIWGIKTYSKNSITINDSIGQIFEIVEDKDKTLWFASWNDDKIPEKKAKGGLYRFKDSKTSYMNDNLGIKSQQVFSLYYDNYENLLWIGTIDYGIYVFSLSGLEYSGASEYNSGKPIFNDIFIDKTNNTWMTVGDEIFKNGKQKISLSPEKLQAEQSKLLKEKYSYLLDRNGSFNKYDQLIKTGIYKYSNPYFSNGKIKIEKSEYNPKTYKVLMKRTLTNYYYFYEDSANNIWVNSNCGLTLKFDKGDNTSIFDLGQLHFFFLESDNVYTSLGTYELMRISIKDQSVLSGLKIRKNATYASMCKYLKDDGFFWIYNDTEGIVKYKNGNVTEFPWLNGKIDLGFTALCKDYKNNIIAGTNTGKIIILTYDDDSLKIVRQISPADGILGTDIRWVQTDNNKQLWFATNKGLNKINLATLYSGEKTEISFYSDENGFNDKLTKKCIKDSEGNLLVISNERLFKINPGEFVKNNSKPISVLVDEIDINFKPAVWSGKTETDKWTGLPLGKFELPYTENSLTFYYHAFQFSEPSKCQYRYKLEGFQKEWTPYTSDTKAVFTNLPEGDYSFKIDCFLLSDPKVIAEKEIFFRIFPPWWKTWWFMLFVLLFVLSVTWIYLRYRVNQVRKKSEINHKLASLKLEALKVQMNPHFIFNAFNSIQKYILNKDNISALNYMSDFAVLIRKTLDNSTKEVITLTDEISYITSYLELEKRRITNLNYVIELDKNIEPDEYYLPPMLIQPVIENSILHGIRHMDTNGLITVYFNVSEKTQMLICTVEDNGIGRTASKELYITQGKTHTSLGSQIIQQRADLFGVKMKITDTLKNGMSAGTKVEFYF